MSASKISSEAAAIEEHHLGVRKASGSKQRFLRREKSSKQFLRVTQKQEALRSDAFDQQDVILGEEREQKRLEDSLAAAEAKEREQREREEAEREAAEREAAAAAEEARKRKEEAAKLETSDSTSRSRP